MAPQYASAKSHSKALTLASLANSISSDYKATNKQLGVIERLYDTCALTSSLWARSFSDIEEQATAWTAKAENQGLAVAIDLSRCYASGADYDGTTPADWGVLFPGVNPDDSWTATAP